MNWKNETALVTGASSGIGLEMCRQLAAGGSDLVLVSRSKDKLDKLKAELEGEFGIKATVVTADLSQSGAGQKLYNDCKKLKLVVTLLVNNAGAGQFGLATDLSIEETQSMLMLNIQGLTSLTQLFAADMTQKGSGRILQVGSLVGRFSSPYFSAYAASKAYVRNFSIAVRRELKKAGVSLTLLEPGFVRTAFEENADISSSKYLKMSHRMGMDPDKVAKVGLKAAYKRRGVVQAGFSNKLSALFSMSVPQWFVAAMFYANVKAML